MPQSEIFIDMVEHYVGSLGKALFGRKGYVRGEQAVFDARKRMEIGRAHV